MKSIFLTVILFALAHANDISEPKREILNQPIATALGQTNPTVVTNVYDNKCALIFKDKFQHLTPLSNGIFGRVYIATSKEDKKKFILKSIPRKLSIIPSVISKLQGTSVGNEILIGKALNEHVISHGAEEKRSTAFVVTQDWFTCNQHDVMKDICEGKECPRIENLPRNKYDTDFIIQEFIPGTDVFQHLRKLDQDSGANIPKLAAFVKSVTFQVFLALQKAYDLIEFAHLDMNFNNIRLEMQAGDSNSDNFLFKYGGKEWRVPLRDSTGYRARIIDFGITRARTSVSKDSQTIRPSFIDFTPLECHQFSLTMFLMFLMQSIRKQTLKEWKDQMPQSYDQFTEMFTVGMGFTYMDRFRALLTRFQTLKKDKRQPMRFGIPDNISEEKIHKTMMDRGVLRLGILTALGRGPIKNGEVQAKKLLEMDFFSDYRPNR